MNAPSPPFADTGPALEQALLAAGHMALRYDRARDEVRQYGAVRALTGRAPGSVLRFAEVLETIHPEDRAKVALLERRPPSVDAPHRLRFRFVHPDGTTIGCEAFGDPFGPRGGDRDGVGTGVVVPLDAPRASFDRALLLAEIVQTLPETVSVHAEDGRCLSVNAAGRRLLGLDPEEDVGRLALEDLVSDANSVPVSRLIPTALRDGAHATDVVLVDRASGRHIPAAWAATRLDDAPSGRRLVVCIARDIRNTLEIEWELRQNQRRLTHALEVSRLGEWSMDIRTQTSHQSPRVAEIFGYPEAIEPWTYRVFLDHVHPDDRERVDRLFSRSLDTGRDLDFEARIVRADGDPRWISVRASLNRGLAGEGQIIGGVIQDITERKFVEQRDRFLADVSVPLNTLVDHRSTLEQVARLAVPFLADHCSIDLAGDGGHLSRVVSTSSLLASEAVGDNASADAPPVAPPPSAVRRALEAGETVVLDVVEPALLDSFARTRSERLSLRALGVRSYLGVPLSLRGRRIGVLHFYRTEADVQYTPTDVKVAGELAGRVAVALENARLYQALQDSDHRKDEFLAMLSHEIRNPLESLAMGVSLIEADESDTDWARAMMRGQITRLAGILEDLLDVSRYTFNKVVLERVRTDLGAMLGDLVEERRPEAERAGYELVATLPRAPAFVEVDVLRIAQVVGNLLTNAIKYGGEGGRIEASLEVDAGGRPGPGWAVVRVADEGIGIEAEELPHVFEMFAQVDATIDRSRGGLGMGLTLVKRIVEMHGGVVEAESDGPGCGTRFTLRLPLAGAGASAGAELAHRPDEPSARRDGGSADAAGARARGRPDASGAGAPERPANRRLMLVDDNLETVAALEKLFAMKGYEVRTAHDGPAALALAEAFDPHMAVLDIGLPGASGYEVAATLRERRAGRPLLLIALSGYGQQKDRDRSREAGFDHHLLKPVNFRSVLELLQGYAPPG